ncbi:MAG: EAL domain-containing protein [Oceanospirillales bacterium]|nr:EAL domain-containing protein [Oceanospirillales bacterium]
MSDNSPLILVVEDSASIRVLLKSGLGRAGYSVIEAANGLEGVKLFLANQPDLVLMDVDMPEMNGFAACAELRRFESGALTPVLMLTGSDDYDSINLAFDAGATDFIAKPINLPLLTQRIRYALRDAEREATLRRAQRQQDHARALAGLVYWEWDTGQNWLNWSDDAAQLLSWLGKLPTTMEDFAAYVEASDRKRFMSALRNSISNGVSFDFEVCCTDTKRQERILRIVGQNDQSTAVVNGAIQDVTSQRSLERQANYLNYYDAVTGLPNRQLFLSSSTEALDAAQANGTNVFVLVIEIQRFHQFSEAYGTEVSDTLLRLVAGQLRQVVPDNGLCARLEGALFAMHCSMPGNLEEQQVMTQIDQCLRTLVRPWSIDEKEVFLTFSGGVASSAQHQDASSVLLRMALAAQRKNRAVADLSLSFYSEDQSSGLRHRLSLESVLRRSVEQNDFYLLYQPQVELASNNVVGVEALVRWNNPGGTFVSPGEFIPILEDMGLIGALGEWILHEACRQQVAWRACGHDIRMSINLSAAQFEHPQLPELIRAAATSAGADTRQIKLEITESMAMGDPDATLKVLQQLKSEGFKIAIDDFGVGFSSLEYLQRFPLDTLKIDRAFIHHVARGQRDRAIVGALTSLCNGLGLGTIAEGVETQRQCDYLDALGVQEIQGYLFSRPLAADDLAGFIEERDTARH